MKTETQSHTATYLDSGFYIISDKAAGALVRVLGQKLPKHGYEKFVMLATGEHRLNAWMQRTPTCLLKRKWHWSLYALRPDGTREPVTLGRSFVFQPIASTQTRIAA